MTFVILSMLTIYMVIYLHLLIDSLTHPVSNRSYGAVSRLGSQCIDLGYLALTLTPHCLDLPTVPGNKTIHDETAGEMIHT